MYTRRVGEAEQPSTGDVAGSILADLEAGGELVDTGGFTIDSQQARRKLREFLLADPHAWVLLLIEAAVLGGAESVRVDIEGGNITIDLGPLCLGVGELENLFAAAFFTDTRSHAGSERNRRRALQKLAHACNAALRLDLHALEITARDGQGGAHRLRLSPKDDRGLIEQIEEVPSSTFVRSDCGELARLTVQEPPECELIRRHCVFSPVPIELAGRRISKGLQYALHVELSPDELSLSPRARQVTNIELDGQRIGCAGMRYSGKLPAEVTILTNGVLAERFVLGDAQRPAAPDFGAIVNVDLERDLGHNKLLRNPEFERVMAAIWAVHDRIAPAGFGAPVSSHRVIGGGLEQFRWPFAALVVGVTLAAWGIGEGGAQAELIAVFGFGLVATGIVGVVLGVLRSLQR